MRRTTIVVGCVVAVAGLTNAGAQEPGAAARATVYEGARLIVGDGSAPIENAVFLVENARFTRVGRRGDVSAPPGAARIDLTGKTVIPALVDGHSHIGYMKDLTSGASNYTRENILDHMYRFAYFGVAASQSMGSDFGEMPFQVRDDILAGKYPDAARFLSAGRGLSPLPEISPDNMRHAAFPVTTPEGARASVQELVPHRVALIKTWVDDRGGTIKKLTPDLYGAIIDEAHAHKLRVAVHATGLRDAKDLLRAGIDVFAHMIGDVDDELVALFKQHPNTAVLSALGGPHRAVYAPWLNPVHPLILETVLPEQIKRLQGRFPQSNPDQFKRSHDAWDRLARGISRLSAAGVKIGVGTDGGGQQGDQFIGWTMHTELENMVMAGIPPAKALVAATRTSAEILGLDDLGEVAVGKSADFVVLDANPLEDITNTRKISTVYLRGRRVDRETLRARFLARQRERPRSGSQAPALMQTGFVDDARRTVALPSDTTRVFAAGAPAEVLLYTLVPDMLVGRNRVPEGEALEFFPPAYRNPVLIRQLPEIDNPAADAELLALKPDLYIDYGTVHEDYIAALEAVQRRTNVPGIILDGALPRIPDTYRRLGAALGVAASGERLAAAADRLLTKYRGVLASSASPLRVYLACSADGFQPCLADDSAGEQLAWLGGVNVAGTRASAPKRPLSIEEIKALAPNAIVVTGGAGAAARLRANPAWQDVDAVAAGRVYQWPGLPYSWGARPPSVNRLPGVMWLAYVLAGRAFDASFYADVRGFYQDFYHLQLLEPQLRRLVGE